MEAISVIAIMGMVLWSLRIQASMIPGGGGARSGVEESQDWEGPSNVQQWALTLSRWEETSRAFHRIP